MATYTLTVAHDYDNEDGFIEFNTTFELSSDEEAKIFVAETFEHLINVHNCMGATLTNDETEEELSSWLGMP